MRPVRSDPARFPEGCDTLTLRRLEKTATARTLCWTSGRFYTLMASGRSRRRLAIISRVCYARRAVVHIPALPWGAGMMRQHAASRSIDSSRRWCPSSCGHSGRRGTAANSDDLDLPKSLNYAEESVAARDCALWFSRTPCAGRWPARLGGSPGGCGQLRRAAAGARAASPAVGSTAGSGAPITASHGRGLRRRGRARREIVLAATARNGPRAAPRRIVSRVRAHAACDRRLFHELPAALSRAISGGPDGAIGSTAGKRPPRSGGANGVFRSHRLSRDYSSAA